MKTDNRKYIDRGKLLVVRESPDAEAELAKMNRGKNGRPFEYPDSIMACMATFKALTRAPYRACHGMFEEYHGHSPAYNTIQRRINRLDIRIDEKTGTATGSFGTIRFAIDSTGISLSCSGNYMSTKHGPSTRHEYLKMHVVLDIDRWRIRSVRITESSKGDAPQLPGMLEEAVESVRREEATARQGEQAAVRQDNSPRPVQLLGDGAYGSEKNFEECTRRGVEPVIRVAINAVTSGSVRGMAVRDQLGGGARHTNIQSTEAKLSNQKEWKKRTGYGYRWLVEAWFSAFKRMFGERLYSRRRENQVQELLIKVACYNGMVAMAA